MALKTTYIKPAAALHLMITTIYLLLVCIGQNRNKSTLQCWIEQLVQIELTPLVCEKSTLQIELVALVCDFRTIQIIFMALKLISHNPNSTHGPGFYYTEPCLQLRIL